MAPSIKLQDIDQKIKDLQDRKKLLEQKQINDLAKLIKKTEAHILQPEVLIGSILETIEIHQQSEDSETHQEKINYWEKKGKDLLDITKKSKGVGKNTDPSFPQSDQTTKADS
ncbi:hypothetical protein [Candidatus Finniella inopinata]|uniref:Conjugal transfer protein TraD n=1 Tax=Candidatus Finniella inopinata TaxID=1696036 RepID=A0A4Q7DHS9_9PROT|nr:hypothetical protein [Candidatus Finniella inopinata]RZI45484.1 hypothetical protein EQU50_06990 [Candidatus Finniella inopinata]